MSGCAAENLSNLGTSQRAARRIHASWPGSELTFVRHAGHMPQVEDPVAFVDALVSFVEEKPTASSSVSA